MVFYKILNFFHFPQVIENWNRKLCVEWDGHASEYLSFERGVKQGCPLSPYLFIIAAEEMTLTVRQGNDIIGI